MIRTSLVGVTLRLWDGRTVAAMASPSGAALMDSRGRVAVRNAATKRLSYIPERRLRNYAAIVSPVCHVCGFVMVERFRYEPINKHATMAHPTGVFDCLHCATPPEGPTP